MPKRNRIFAGSVALSLALTLGACGGMPTHRGLESVNQPVVERTNYTFDVRSGSGGLSIPEQRRLADWFDAVDLRYGDRVSIDDPTMNPGTRDAISQIAARHGILLADGAPVTPGVIQPGSARVVITRSMAHVPGCPDWSQSSDMNYNNATSSNYGCSVNSNIAAMVANPEDLIRGQRGTGETVVMSSTKAIDSYREQAPTGEQGLAEPQTNGD